MRDEATLARWSGIAPAKVNLHLQVLAREESGHHQLETELQALELADRLTVELRAEPGIELHVAGVAPGELGPDRENLAVRAARAYLEAAEIPRAEGPGVTIRLEKRIPHGAGLGGGSSDSAAVLRALESMGVGSLGLPRLVELGSSLGADVPFFVLDVPRALGWGRGDRLLSLGSLPPRPVVVAVPREGISTAWAYERLAEVRREEGRGYPGGCAWSEAGAEGWEEVAGRARNDFQPVMESARPELRLLREALRDAGAGVALLCGSGAGVFGVFPDDASAHAAEDELRSAFPAVRVIRTRTRG